MQPTSAPHGELKGRVLATSFALGVEMLTAILAVILAVFLWIRFQVYRGVARERRRRFIVREALYLVGFYGMVTLMLMWLERSMVFRPTTHDQGWDQPAGLAFEDVWLSLADGTRIHGWWCPCPNAECAVLYSHGNGGNLSHRAWGIADWHRLAKASVLLYDYPGYGRSGGHPTEEACYASGQAFYRWLREARELTPDQIVLLGESLGGGVAVELALTVPHRVLVCFATFTSIPDMAQQLLPFLPARWLVSTQFNNAEKLARYRGNLLLAHAVHDPVVPFGHGERLNAVATHTAWKEFLVLPDAGHGPVPTELMTRLAACLRREDLARIVEPITAASPQP